MCGMPSKSQEVKVRKVGEAAERILYMSNVISLAAYREQHRSTCGDDDNIRIEDGEA